MTEFTAGGFTFRLAQETDLPTLADWIARPHWQAWWGEPSSEVGWIRDMIEGRDTTKPYIFEIDGEPIGYIQVWQIGPHQNEEWTRDHPWLIELRPDAVGVDLSIADEDKLNKGLGSKALNTFALRLHNEGHRTIIIDPAPANARAVSAYRKAGFKPIPRLEGKTKDVLLMQFEPNATTP